MKTNKLLTNFVIIIIFYDFDKETKTEAPQVK